MAILEGTRIFFKIDHDQSEFSLLVVQLGVALGNKEITMASIHIDLKEVIPIDVVK